ncbi:MAG: AAA family ATPase [Candidatus Tectomicrobia bacterium]|uniref:AAA family ATPase n=1 Tax=Tectimicrobiota bacterium TaxID=2528274 RepID=A0A933LQ65_UNCTE|nr:AAA family ATPase [Candidatus Tectomicrobia bacterium]
MAALGKKVDLHFHSQHSDGAFLVPELLDSLKAHGYSAGALTDHDHVGGLDEGLPLARELKMELVPGIELSSQYRDLKEIHVLGYYFDYKNSFLREKLNWFQSSRIARAKGILDNINKALNKQGRPLIPYQDIASGVKGSFGRPHIAQRLLDLGYVRSMEQAFHDYLIPYNVPKAYFSPKEAIELIHQAKGLAVLAHPKFLTDNKDKLHTFLELMVNWGLDGLEVYYPDLSPDETSRYLSLAYKLGLLITGGSDYHSPSFGHGSGPGEKMLHVPYHCLREIKRAFFRMNRTLVIMYGLPTSGKTFVAEALAKEYRFYHIMADKIRQDTFRGLEPAGFGKEIKYSRDASIMVYSKMWEEASKQLALGNPVIVDGTFLLNEARQKFYFLASKLNATFVVLKCLCPEETIEKRMVKRVITPDPYSEADWEVYLKMKQNVEGSPPHIFGNPDLDRFEGGKAPCVSFDANRWEESGNDADLIDLVTHELILSILGSDRLA